MNSKRDNNGIVTEIDDLLEQERASVTKGDLEGLETLIHVKEALIEKLAHITIEEGPALSRLRAKIVRNQGLLDSARMGVRDVVDRLAAMDDVQSTLRTYAQTGERLDFDVPGRRTLERRA